MNKVAILTLSVLLALTFFISGSVMAQDEDWDSEDEMDMAIFGWIVGLSCILPIVLIIIFILIAIWVYKDANSRGMNGVLWLIVVLMGTVAGLIIYLVIRKDHPVGSAPRPEVPLMGYPQSPPYYQYPPPYYQYPQYPQTPPQYPQYPQAPPQYPQGETQYPQEPVSVADQSPKKKGKKKKV